MGIRAFVAIDLPETVRREVAALRAKLGLGHAPLKWVEERNLHVTIKFLGDVPDAAVADVLAVSRLACAPEAPFELEIAGVGTFPPGRPPRVLWAGVTENAEIVKRLASKIDKDLEALGIEPEGKPFHPHVTIARVKDGAPPSAVPGGIAASGIGTVGRLRVSELALKSSRLGPSGPVYSTIGDLPLRGAS